MALSLKRTPRFPPREPRQLVRLKAYMLLPDDREVPIVITNLSHCGFMARALVTPEEGTRLGVSLPGTGILRAQVRWVDNNRFGALFEGERSQCMRPSYGRQGSF